MERKEAGKAVSSVRFPQPFFSNIGSRQILGEQLNMPHLLTRIQRLATYLTRGPWHVQKGEDTRQSICRRGGLKSGP